MTEKNLKTRLGKRLKALFERIPAETDCFYDLCCDHGAVGRAVLEQRERCHVVFNDIHPDIMASLANLLERFQAENYRLAIGPAQQATLIPAQQPTVLLAGIGDEQCLEILDYFMNQNATRHAHYIISPATKVHNVRKWLRSQHVNLLHESTVTENKRTYEIIEVKKDLEAPHHQVDLFGHCWETGNPQHQNHLAKLIAFYAAQQKGKLESYSKAAVDGYQLALKKISTPS